MKLTPHFTLSEVEHSDTAKRLGLDNSVPKDLMPNVIKMCEALEQVRALFDRPLMITSFYRGKELNDKVGGSKTSAHCFGCAADFTVKDVDLEQAIMGIKQSEILFDQLIHETSSKGSAWIHLGLPKDGSKPRRMVMTGIKTDKGSTFRVENG